MLSQLTLLPLLLLLHLPLHQLLQPKLLRSNS
jgi:hypothetical protein